MEKNITYLVCSSQFEKADKRYFQLLVYCRTQKETSRLQEMAGISIEPFCDGKVSDFDTIKDYGCGVILSYRNFEYKYTNWLIDCSRRPLMDY